MQSVAVLVPWAGACPHRRAAWHHVRNWYQKHHSDWQVTMGFSRPGPQWCKAEAVADALRDTSADILVIADADCIPPGIGAAVGQVREGAPWAMPHYKVHRLSEGATQLVLDGIEPEELATNRKVYAQHPYIGYPGGGVTAIHRDVYESVPLDPRYRGWGQEDESWAMALQLLHGEPWRPESVPLWHLWHPPQQRLTRVTGSHASRELLGQYRRAVTPRGMTRLLEPAVQLVRSVSHEQNLA